MLKKRLFKLLLSIGLLLPTAVFAMSITAGGSTAIYPVLSKWAKAYEGKQERRSTTNQLVLVAALKA